MSRQPATRFLIPLAVVACLLHAHPPSAATRIGMFWNTDLTPHAALVASPPEVVTGHIAIRPHDPVEILGWECAVRIDGPANVTAWNVPGQAINTATPPEFAVGLATPLPGERNIVVATFGLLVTDTSAVTVALEPIRFASLEGEMAFIGAEAPSELVPMGTANGEPTVATVNIPTGTLFGTDWIHVVCFGPVIVPDSSCVLVDVTFTRTEETAVTDGTLHIEGGAFFPVFGYGVRPVGIAAPTPLVVQQGGRIDLAWPTRTETGGGYHVYRSGGDGEIRLTGTLLPEQGETIRYSDRPRLRAGTELSCWYSMVDVGAELARSPAVDIPLSSVPRLVSRLEAGVPNPFNPQTDIRYTVGRAGPTRLDVYDATGRHVAMLVDEDLPAGERTVTWRGRDDASRPAASGAYTVQLQASDGGDRPKLALLK